MHCKYAKYLTSGNNKYYYLPVSAHALYSKPQTVGDVVNIMVAIFYFPGNVT